MNADPRLSVLVVDDHQDAATAVAALLSDWGYDVRTAFGGVQALEMAETARPDCVLLDVRMPGMDGVELARQLRRRYAGDITLIAMTGAEDSGLQYQIIIALVDHYLKKPIDSAALQRILRKAEPTA